MPRSSHQPTAVLQQTTRLLCLAVWLFAARGIAQQTNALTRSLSLKECIEMALQKNLELQIERHSPQIARYRLGASYGIYDPSFGFAAQRDFLDQPRSFDPKKSGVDFPYELTTDSFSSGISGKLPTGLTYGLGARAAQWDARTDFSSFPVTAANFPPDGIRLTNQYFLSTGIILRQPLLRNFWIDADRLNIQVSRKNLQISEMALLGKIHSTVASVQMAYYELIYALETVKVQNIALELARQFVSETRSQVKLGILPQLEENQAEARFETVRSDLALAEQAVGDRRDNLRNLLIDDIKEWVGVGLEPSEPLLAVEERFERVEGWRNAMMKRPDLLQMKLDLEKQDITLRYDRNQLFPSLDVLGSYGWSAVDHSLDVATDDIGRGAHPTYSYGVVLSVPSATRRPGTISRPRKRPRSRRSCA